MRIAKVGLAILGLTQLGTPAWASDLAKPLPKVGQCFATRVAKVETRLEGMPDSGSAISFVNGRYQVSYERVPGIVHSQVGDPVRMCVIALPQNCPVGDTRGVIYRSTNRRTGEHWQAPDSEHGCGGA